MTEKLLTAKEVAAILRYSEGSIRSVRKIMWQMKGATIVGKRLLVPEPSVFAWLDKQGG